MPITTAICTSYKTERDQAIHAPTDTYKCALIKASPSGTLGADDAVSATSAAEPARPCTMPTARLRPQP